MLGIKIGWLLFIGLICLIGVVGFVKLWGIKVFDCLVNILLNVLVGVGCFLIMLMILGFGILWCGGVGCVLCGVLVVVWILI